VLDGSCRTPIAGYARIEDGVLQFNGLIASNDGREVKRVHMAGDVADAEKIGREAGEKLKAATPA